MRKLRILSLFKFLVGKKYILFFLLSPIYTSAQIALYAEEEIENDISIQGLVASDEEAIISGELSSRIEYIVDELDQFKEGEVLVRLDCKLFEAEKNIVKSNLDIAKIQHKKNVELYSRRAVGKNDLDISAAEYLKAQSEFEITEINTQRCIINAPFNGIVTEISANSFEFVQKHQQLMKLVNLDKLIVKFLLPARYIKAISLDKEINIIIEELDIPFRGSVKSIDKLIDPVSQTIKVHAYIINPAKEIVPGMTASILL